MSIMVLQNTPALAFAAGKLAEMKLPVTNSPGNDTEYLLLPVPSFTGGSKYITPILGALPRNITICGGNLNHPAAEHYRTIDFLQDPYYLADNAAITADCAMDLAGKNWPDLPVLILGWGRISKCLARNLALQGADITVAARKDTDLAMAHGLGFKIRPISRASENISQYRAIFNTVPQMILPNISCHPECIALDLASNPGMSGQGIVTARGLPGKYAPERSGALIAKTFARLALGKEELL